MPELPEVETVRRRLLTCLPGLLVRDVLLNDATVSEQSEPELRALLAGRRVTGLRRRGKYLIVDLGAPQRPGRQAEEPAAAAASAATAVSPAASAAPAASPALPAASPAAPSASPAAASAGPTVAVIHLRMTGQVLFRPGPAERPPRFVWLLEPRTELHFQDVRRFGRLWAFPPAREAEFFAGMGPEPFGEDFTVEYLRRELEGRRAPLKSFLMDQRRIAGVGNIYADEALFRARLHPLRASGSIGPREARRLHAALLETLQAGIDHEGSSIESFVDPAGVRGSFQEILSVYQRTGEPCRVCGTTLRRTVVGGRGTHFCPHCQPRRGGMSPGSRRLQGSETPPRPGKTAGGGPPAV